MPKEDEKIKACLTETHFWLHASDLPCQLVPHTVIDVIHEHGVANLIPRGTTRARTSCVARLAEGSGLSDYQIIIRLSTYWIIG